MLVNYAVVILFTKSISTYRPTDEYFRALRLGIELSTHVTFIRAAAKHDPTRLTPFFILFCTGSMASKDKGKDALKQKSLTSFFSKAPVVSSNSHSKPNATRKDKLTVNAKSNIDGDASSNPNEPCTPETKALNKRILVSSVAASSASSRAGSTPPTSDPIDVDMVSERGEDTESPAYTRSVVRYYF